MAEKTLHVFVSTRDYYGPEIIVIVAQSTDDAASLRGGIDANHQRYLDDTYDLIRTQKISGDITEIPTTYPGVYIVRPYVAGLDHHGG